MEHIESDVLVVGSGAAGLRAAISAKQKDLDVCVISKQASGKATCTFLTLVFGARAGEAAANWAMNDDRILKTEIFKDADVEKFALAQEADRSNSAELMTNLNEIIWQEAGIIRNQPGLERALIAVNTISEKALRSNIGSPLDVQRRIEILFGAQAASLIIQAALKRKAAKISLGGQTREDKDL